MNMDLAKYGDFGDYAPIAGSVLDPHSLGYVYVIGFEEPGIVKIGSATSPFNRLAELQCGNPFELRLLYAVSLYDVNPILIEFAAHKIAAESNIRGEWFSMEAWEALVIIIKAARNAKAKFGALIDSIIREKMIHSTEVGDQDIERRRLLRIKLGMDA